MSKYMVLKLVSGEEVLGKVVPQAMGTAGVTLEQPFALQTYHDQSTGFADFMTAANTKVVPFKAEHIMLQLDATDDAIAQYKTIIDSIEEAAKKAEGPGLILPGDAIVTE